MTGTVFPSFASRFWSPILSGMSHDGAVLTTVGDARSLLSPYMACGTYPCRRDIATNTRRATNGPLPDREVVHNHTHVSANNI